MVQAHALLVAAALTATVSPILAAPAPTCEQIREHAQKRGYSKAKVIALAKRAKLSNEQLAAVLDCLGDTVK